MKEEKYIVLRNNGNKGNVNVDFLDKKELEHRLSTGLYKEYDFLNSKNWDCINGAGPGKRIIIIKNGEVITPAITYDLQ